MPNFEPLPPYVWYPIELGGAVKHCVMFFMADILAGESDMDGVHVYLMSYLRELFDMPDSQYASVLKRFRQDPDGLGRYGESLFAIQNLILSRYYLMAHGMDSPNFIYNSNSDREGRGLIFGIQDGNI